MRIQPVHPFPARMAPELAIDTLRDLPRPGVVLDPMAGSGTVLRHAGDMGHVAVGYDVDPLAVLISKVWTRPINDGAIESTYQDVLGDALSRDPLETCLPWIDSDKETCDFVNYWFGREQQRDLRCISSAILERCGASISEEMEGCLDLLKVALSRIIVTKEQCASLARDTSHSRPHRVASVSDYKVYQGFERSVHEVRKRLLVSPPRMRGAVSLGDARQLEINDESIDMVITSPPYLNAIDYLRGHRLSLVWLGYQLSGLRMIRSGSVGAERGPDAHQGNVDEIVATMGRIEDLPARHEGMIRRYAHDVNCIVREVSRVLRPGGYATFVVGNSCLKDVFVSNSGAIGSSAALNGLTIREEFERELPRGQRYLPITEDGTLGKRIRTETILKCVKTKNGNAVALH